MPPGGGARSASSACASDRLPDRLGGGVLPPRGGRVEDARVVLGAVAPVPLRAVAAEAALNGRRLEEVTTAAFARHVAAFAVEGAQPLVGSAYKTQIVGTMVARAVAQAAGETHSSGGRQR